MAVNCSSLLFSRLSVAFFYFSAIIISAKQSEQTNRKKKERICSMKKYALRLLAPLFALFLLLPAIPKGYATTSFVASVNSDVYHVSSCFYVDRIKESNRIWFTSAEEAEASGRRGCSQNNTRAVHPKSPRKTQPRAPRSNLNQIHPSSPRSKRRRARPPMSTLKRTHFRKNTSEGMMLDIKRASKTETRKGSNKHRKKMKLK